jgi:hypothetical protein
MVHNGTPHAVVEPKDLPHMSFPDFVYLVFNLLSAVLAAIAGYQWWQSYDAARLGDQNESLNRNWKAGLAASLAAFGQAAVICRPAIDFLAPILGLQ